MSDGVKHDFEKLPLDLIPPDCEDMLAAVLQFGALVYARNNWQKVEGHRYYSAGRRHHNKRRKGEMFDADSGLPHSAHALCCDLFLLWQDLQTLPKEEQDRIMKNVPAMAKAYKERKEKQQNEPDKKHQA